MAETSANDSYRRVLANAPLRAMLVYWAIGNTALWAWVVIVSTVAFEAGGPIAVAMALAARLLPGAIASPFVAVAASWMHGFRGLILIVIVRASAMVLGAAVVFGDAPIELLYLFVAFEGLASCPMHAIHVRLLPLIAEHADELVAANSLTELLRAAGLLVGPALAALAIAISGPAVAMMIFTIILISAWPLLAVTPAHVAAPGGDTALGCFDDVYRGIQILFADNRILVLVLVSVSTSIMLGTIQVFLTAIAIDTLDWGRPGPSVLMGLVGLGGLFGGAFAMPFALRGRMAAPLAAGFFVIGTGTILLGALPSPVPVGLASVAGGVGLSLQLVMLNTILQRTVAVEAQAAIFGFTALIQFCGVALGGAVGSAMILLLGIHFAAVAFGLAVTVVGFVAWRVVGLATAQMRSCDLEIAVVRTSKLLAMLAVGPAYQLASRMERLDLAAGTTIISEGETGREAFLIASGSVEVTVGGKLIAERTVGDVIGEIALLKDVTRTATVASKTPVELWRISKEDFLMAVLGRPDCFQLASTVAEQRLVETARK